MYHHTGDNMLYIVPVNTSRVEELKLKVAWESAQFWLASRSKLALNVSLLPREDWAVESSKDPVVWDTAQLRAKRLLGRGCFIVKGAGGFAGSNKSAKVAVVGDYAIDAITNGHYVTPEGHTYTSNSQIGSIIHEVLHMYGLRHEDGGIMSAALHNWPDTFLPTKAQYTSLFTRPWSLSGWFRRVVYRLV